MRDTCRSPQAGDLAELAVDRRTVTLLGSPLAEHQSTEWPSNSPIKAAPRGLNTETAFCCFDVSWGMKRTTCLVVPVTLSRTSTCELTATTFSGSSSSGTIFARDISRSTFDADDAIRLFVSAEMAMAYSLSRSASESMTGGSAIGWSWGAFMADSWRVEPRYFRSPLAIRKRKTLRVMIKKIDLSFCDSYA